VIFAAVFKTFLTFLLRSEQLWYVTIWHIR